MNKKIDKENALDEQFKVTMKLAGAKETERYWNGESILVVAISYITGF